MVTKNLIIIGGGGHAKVLISTLQRLGNNIAGILDSNPKAHGKEILGVKILGDDSYLNQFSKDEVLLVNGICSTESSRIRKIVFESFKSKGFSFHSVIDESAVVGKEVTLGEGVQVLANAVIGPGVHLKNNVIVNNGAVVEHDSVVESHGHISPGSILCGGVSVGEETHIGCGSSIIQNIKIGSRSLVGAGSVVVKDIGDDTKVRNIFSKENYLIEKNQIK